MFKVSTGFEYKYGLGFILFTFRFNGNYVKQWLNIPQSKRLLFPALKLCWLVHIWTIIYWNLLLTVIKLSTNIKNIKNIGRMLLDLNLFDQALKSRCLCQTIHQYCQPTHLTWRIRLIFDSDIKMILKTIKFLETFSAQCETFWGSHNCFLYHNVSRS